MPDKRKHRGAAPEDEAGFGGAVELLREAVVDMSHLLGRGYSSNSTLKLVGDRYDLTSRQRLAVLRCSCSDERVLRRCENEVGVNALSGQSLAVDGFNLLITVEAALSGGFIFVGRDDCFRDLSSVHGTYRKVLETPQAIEIVGEFLDGLGIADVQWYLDRPVSNSGQLKTLLTQTAAQRGWQWDVELVYCPDKELAASNRIIVSTDSVVLDRCSGWVNLARLIIERYIPAARVVTMK